MNTTTCIVALKSNAGEIWIGSDSAGVYPGSLAIQEMRLPKVFRNGPCLIGYTTSFRMGQLLQFKLRVPDRTAGQDTDHFMVHDFTEAVRECFKEGGFAKVHDERHSGGTFIVIYDGEIFVIESDYACLTYKEPFAAVGCGREYALGAIGLEYWEKDPDQTVLKALRTASHFSAGVMPPFHLICDARPDIVHTRAI